MIDGLFVFDHVIHVYDMDDANLRADRPDAESARVQLLESGRRARPPGYMADVDFARRWTVEDVYEMVFVDAPTDMAMAQVVPLFDWYEDLFSPVRAQHAMATAYPERVLFCGGVDPLYRGLADALDQLDHQVRELGARSIKFYNGHLPKSWSCDDEQLAYPLYERCRELGIDVLQFHKGTPIGLQDVESLRPVDLQRPARDFPDMQFVVHHLALPYLDELINIASRFQNVHVSLTGVFNYCLVAPRRVQEILGRLLAEVGSERLLWGSEAALLGSPGPYLDAFMALEIPEDLQDGYGYPPFTREDRRLILGENFARLMGVDPVAARARIEESAA